MTRGVRYKIIHTLSVNNSTFGGELVHDTHNNVVFLLKDRTGGPKSSATVQYMGMLAASREYLCPYICIGVKIIHRFSGNLLMIALGKFQSLICRV